MVNEEDHLREQYILKTFNLYKAYERMSGIDEELEKKLPFAFDEKLGYLSACPTNLGTGLRASVLMFLPGLSQYKKLEKLRPALERNGLTVRGGFGEGTLADGFTYQISNERTLGYSEQDILSHMDEVTLNLAELEVRAREKMLAEYGLHYKDVCLRAYGALCNCANLSVGELESEVVKVRLGVALGFFGVPKGMDAFNDFIANMRPASFKVGNCAGLNEQEADIRRAEIVGKVLPGLVKRKV
jgi:protein arginine kinase